MYVLRAVNYPCRIAFNVSQRVFCVVFSFSFSPSNIFTSFLVSSLTHLSLSNELFIVHVFVNLLEICLLSI